MSENEIKYTGGNGHGSQVNLGALDEPAFREGNETVEAEIQRKGLNAPRVKPADLEANIAAEYYFLGTDGIAGAMGREDAAAAGLTGDNAEGRTLPVRVLDVHVSLQLLTFCVLVLRNGFTVHGVSACASPENFNAELGKRIARENAVREMWPLMGYALREDLHRAEIHGQAIAVPRQDPR